MFNPQKKKKNTEKYRKKLNNEKRERKGGK